MSAQISSQTQRYVDNAARFNEGWVTGSKATQELRKRGLAVQRDGSWTLSRRGWSAVSEWILRVIDND